jgi:hypothetical protein
MMNTCEMRRAVRRPVSRCMAASSSSSVCRLPFISACALPARHMTTPRWLPGLGFGLNDREIADVDADLRGQCLHRRFRADQRGLNEAGGRGFHGALQRHIAQGPHYGRGDGGQALQRSMNL